jgi:hypothetical protein
VKEGSDGRKQEVTGEGEGKKKSEGRKGRRGTNTRYCP